MQEVAKVKRCGAEVRQDRGMCEGMRRCIVLPRSGRKDETRGQGVEVGDDKATTLLKLYGHSAGAKNSLVVSSVGPTEEGTALLWRSRWCRRDGRVSSLLLSRPEAAIRGTDSWVTFAVMVGCGQGEKCLDHHVSVHDQDLTVAKEPLAVVIVSRVARRCTYSWAVLGRLRTRAKSR